MEDIKKIVAAFAIVLATFWAVGIVGGIENGNCSVLCGIINIAAVVAVEIVAFRVIGDSEE